MDTKIPHLQQQRIQNKLGTHSSNGEEKLDTDNYIAPPKTPDYCQKENHEEMLNTDDENDSGEQPSAITTKANPVFTEPAMGTQGKPPANKQQA